MLLALGCSGPPPPPNAAHRQMTPGGGGTPPGTAQQQLCSPKGPGEQGSKGGSRVGVHQGEPGVAQPQGASSGPRRGSWSAISQGPSVSEDPAPHLLPIGSGSVAGSGPRCSWLRNEGCSGGMVTMPSSLLTLQLEADAAGFGPGQPWGCRWGSPIPLCLAGAPRPQELALLA